MFLGACQFMQPQTEYPQAPGAGTGSGGLENEHLLKNQLYGMTGAVQTQGRREDELDEHLNQAERVMMASGRTLPVVGCAESTAVGRGRGLVNREGTLFFALLALVPFPEDAGWSLLPGLATVHGFFQPLALGLLSSLHFCFASWHFRFQLLRLPSKNRINLRCGLKYSSDWFTTEDDMRCSSVTNNKTGPQKTPLSEQKSSRQPIAK